MGLALCRSASAAAPSAVAAASPASAASPTISNKLALGAGCYWGTEKFVQKDFQKRFPGSIKRARVGFMSPDPDVRIEHPSYEDVCTGRSGYVEVLYVELNDPEKHFEELIRFFFMFHDPTTKNRQGNDSGFQYASFIFCGDDEQNRIAQKVLHELQSFLDSSTRKVFFNKRVTTRIGPLMAFMEATADHQRYLEKHPNGYCNHRFLLKEWPGMEEAAPESVSAKDNAEDQ